MGWLAVALLNWLWPGLALAGVGALVLGWRRKTTLAVCGALIVLSGGARLLNFEQRELQTLPLQDLTPGQYTGHSADLLKLVTVRVVVREGGHLIFAEAHALPIAGLDQQTLYVEPYRALLHQKVPPTIDPNSDPFTAQLVSSALRHALSGDVKREDPTLPDGARRVDSGGDTYWGMFPNEFDHRCDLSKAPDGHFIGKSSNPDFPATVAITIKAGKIIEVEVLDHRASHRGDGALSQLPARVVSEQNTQVDVVSGSTRTSYILRSAIFHACHAALRLESGAVDAGARAVGAD